MYIKRNIKKFTHTQANKPITHKPLVSHNYGEYVIPTSDKVDSGVYHSKLVHAEYTTTKNGEPAIKVLYDMRHGDTIFQIYTGVLPEDTELELYKFKQIYPVDTTYYEAFVDAMADCLDIPSGVKFSLEDTIGVEEYVKIGFNDYNKLGGIVSRCPMSWKEFLKQCRNYAQKYLNNDTYEDVNSIEESEEEPEEETLPPSNDNAPSEDSVDDSEEEPVIEEEKRENKGKILGRKHRSVSKGPLGSRRPIRDKETVKKESPPANTYDDDDDDEFDDFLEDEEDDGDYSLDW